MPHTRRSLRTPIGNSKHLGSSTRPRHGPARQGRRLLEFSLGSATVVTAILGLLVFHPQQFESLTTDSLHTDAFGIGVLDPSVLSFVNTINGTPTIDVSPTRSGDLKGIIRITFEEVAPDHPETAFVFRLPAASVIDFNMTQAPVMMFTGPSGSEPTEPMGDTWSCASEWTVYEVYQQVTDKHSYRDMWHFDCSEEALFVQFTVPPALPREDVVTRDDGGLIETIGSVILPFTIPDYAGLAKTGPGEYAALVAYNSVGLNDFPASSAPADQRVSLRVTGQEGDLAIRSTAGLMEIPAEEFGAGTSFAYVVPFASDTNVIQVTLQDPEETSRLEVLKALFWSLFGVVSAALLGLLITLGLRRYGL